MTRGVKKSNKSKDEIINEVKSFYQTHQKSPRICDVKILTFSKQQVKLIFGTWNKMLELSELPLNRNKAVSLKCSNCNKDIVRQVKEIKKVNKSFCTYKCNQQFYRSAGMYNHSNETKNKISKSLKLHRIFKDK